MGNLSKECPYGICLKSVENFTDTKILFGDYIRLKKLTYGDVFVLENTTTRKDTKVVAIGNGTPSEGISSVSHNSWDYELYNLWRILEVFRIELSKNGDFLHPVNIDKETTKLIEKVRDEQ